MNAKLVIAMIVLLMAVTCRAAEPATQPSEDGFVPIFDGKTVAGWEGDLKVFRIEDGAVVGGSMKEGVKRNEFLCTTRDYANFELRLKFKLLGKGANGGIQNPQPARPRQQRGQWLSGRSGRWLLGLAL